MGKVATEEDFKILSDEARKAVRTATQLLECTVANANKVFTKFCSGLVDKFKKGCFVSRRSTYEDP